MTAAPPSGKKPHELDNDEKAKPISVIRRKKMKKK